MILWENKFWVIGAIYLSPTIPPKMREVITPIIFTITNKEKNINYRLPCLNTSSGVPSIKIAYRYKNDPKVGYYEEIAKELPKYIQEKIEHFWKMRRILSKTDGS